MKFLKDLHTISEFFFYFLGILLFTAFLFWRNNAFAYEAELFLRYADLPFAFVAVLFGASSLRISLSQGLKEESRMLSRKKEGESDPSEDDDIEHPILDAVLIVLGLSIFIGIMYVDFLVPNAI